MKISILCTSLANSEKPGEIARYGRMTFRPPTLAEVKADQMPLPEKLNVTNRDISNRDRKRIEPLVNLVYYYLSHNRSARLLLRNLIRERGPNDKKLEESWPDNRKMQAQYIDRLIEDPVQHRDDQKTLFMTNLLIEQGPNLIAALPETARRDDPRQLATLFYNALMEENLKTDPTTDTATRKRDAFRELFHILPTQMDKREEIEGIEGDYFGYRRSTSRGAIIRFSLSIRHRGGGIFTFENHFRSTMLDWKVYGAGFFRAGNLYLVGNATSDDGKGRGLRCFAIRPEADQELISGIVITTEANSQPIAARILLIPVRNHKYPQDDARKATPLNLKDILFEVNEKRFWVTDDIDVEKLDETVTLAGTENPSRAVVRRIRNGTVSTLRFDGCGDLSINLRTPGADYLVDERFLFDELSITGAPPTILYLRAIAGAATRLGRPKSSG
jgi:hypothetical protein